MNVPLLTYFTKYTANGQLNCGCSVINNNLTSLCQNHDATSLGQWLEKYQTKVCVLVEATPTLLTQTS